MSVQKIKCFLFLLCVSLFSTSFCSEAATSITSDEKSLQDLVKGRPDKENPDKPFNLILPINIYDKNTSLNIIVPKEFKMGERDSGGVKFLQFMGNGMAITVGFQEGGGFQPTQLLDVMIKAMQSSQQMIILESGNHGYFGYMDGYRLVQFSSPNNITHLYYMYVASGPSNSATIIYDMAVRDNEMVGDVVTKIKDVFNTSVHILQDK